ncbi:MAG TPA: HD domain-containing protein, partial [Mycobacteriales bacterium]
MATGTDPSGAPGAPTPAPDEAAPDGGTAAEVTDADRVLPRDETLSADETLLADAVPAAETLPRAEAQPADGPLSDGPLSNGRAPRIAASRPPVRPEGRGTAPGASPAGPTAPSAPPLGRARLGAPTTTGPAAPGAPAAPPPAGGHTGRRVRAALARFGSSSWQGAVGEVLEPLAATHRAAHPKADLKMLLKAYDTAEQFHRGQLRKSGDAYITHPLAVATILADLGMDTTTLIAALLHDTVEDTGYTLEQLALDFGGEVAHLVDGVTKLDKVKFGEAAEAETIRKMVIAMARDPRVLVIKLADRLHNMRTLRFLPTAKQERIARQTLEVLAPLAHRLGMNTVKWELEDLAFQTLYPKRFEEIARLVAEQAPARDAVLAQVIEKVSAELKAAKIKGQVTGRPKHLYSVYQKMIVRGRDLADINDLVGVRILVDSVPECYAVLGVIHNGWNPVPGRIKDYIARPKFNMYQSLHTSVMGPEGKPVEMQIRTWAMHRTAEYGIA